ncbi:MAG: hypothetical protein ABR511_03425 [Acidimicrobiales bacterium]
MAGVSFDYGVVNLSYRYDVVSPFPCPPGAIGAVIHTNVRQRVTDSLAGTTTDYCYDGGAA